MESILASITSTLAPVRREGLPYIAILLGCALLLGWLWQPIFWIALTLAAWCAYFFRDPARVTPIDDSLVVSPADGRVVSITSAEPPPELALAGRGFRRVSIFMSVFDCHVNRAPVAGTVEKAAYRPGKFLVASIDKASDDNERNGIVMATAHGTVVIVQIAGVIARRIVCWAEAGASLAAGERFGLIQFGSRLDVYVPPAAAIEVAEGQTAIAGETVIARFGRDRVERSFRVD